jgi:hypothetical protein
MLDRYLKERDSLPDRLIERASSSSSHQYQAATPRDQDDLSRELDFLSRGAARKDAKAVL